jgi:hypothetical protein
LRLLISQALEIDLQATSKLFTFKRTHGLGAGPRRKY